MIVMGGQYKDSIFTACLASMEPLLGGAGLGDHPFVIFYKLICISIINNAYFSHKKRALESINAPLKEDAETNISPFNRGCQNQ